MSQGRPRTTAGLEVPKPLGFWSGIKLELGRLWTPPCHSWSVSTWPGPRGTCDVAEHVGSSLNPILALQVTRFYALAQSLLTEQKVNTGQFYNMPPFLFELSLFPALSSVFSLATGDSSGLKEPETPMGHYRHPGGELMRNHPL